MKDSNSKKIKKAGRKDEEKTLIDDILDFVKVFVISAIVVLLFVNFIAHPVNVEGRSMCPTLLNGEYGFTNLISLATGKVNRGDIVVVTMPDEETGEEERWVKRIIGLPGETVEGKDGVVYINGEALDESSYLKQDFMDQTLADFKAEYGVDYGPFTSDFGPVTLGEDEYWVMGDNRPHSKDSRYPTVGPVKKDQLYGKGILVLYPFDKIGVK